MSDIIDIYVTFYQRCIEAHVKNPFQPKIETLTTTTTVSHKKNGKFRLKQFKWVGAMDGTTIIITCIISIQWHRARASHRL